MHESPISRRTALKSMGATGLAGAGALVLADTAQAQSVAQVPPPTGNAGTDTTNIQNAANSVSASGGGAVVLQAGAYKLNAQVILPANVDLIGQGGRATVVECTTAASGLLFRANGIFTGNFTVDGTSTGNQPIIIGDNPGGLDPPGNSPRSMSRMRSRMPGLFASFRTARLSTAR